MSIQVGKPLVIGHVAHTHTHIHTYIHMYMPLQVKKLLAISYAGDGAEDALTQTITDALQRIYKGEGDGDGDGQGLLPCVVLHNSDVPSVRAPNWGK
jgi:hypothetical protein